MKGEMTLQELEFQVSKIIGEPLWAATAGKGTGSNVLLKFGKKIEKKSPSQNPNISEDAGKYNGEFDFMIYCPWRIENNLRIISGSSDSNEPDAAMLKGLDTLINKKVKSIKVDPFMDLFITFEDDSVFRTICDISLGEYDRYFMIVTNEQIAYCVNENGEIYHENSFSNSNS